MIYSTSKLDAEKEPIQVQLDWAWWRVLSNYSGMTRTTVQLQMHDVCNCTITTQIITITISSNVIGALTAVFCIN